MRSKNKILIVEDHPIFCMGMTELINQENDLFICGNADNVSSALKAIDKLEPDLVIVDLSLKSSNGIEIIKEIKRVIIVQMVRLDFIMFRMAGISLG